MLGSSTDGCGVVSDLGDPADKWKCLCVTARGGHAQAAGLGSELSMFILSHTSGKKLKATTRTATQRLAEAPRRNHSLNSMGPGAEIHNY